MLPADVQLPRDIRQRNRRGNIAVDKDHRVDDQLGTVVSAYSRTPAYSAGDFANEVGDRFPVVICSTRMANARDMLCARLELTRP
jgi:hypothetical protein